MKINGYVRIAAAVLAVIWMFRIFSFSDAPGSVSMQTSRSVSYDLVKSVNDILGLRMDEDRILGLSRSIEKTVRKLAHMCELWSDAPAMRGDTRVSERIRLSVRV